MYSKFREIVRLAIPNIISNITVPLLSLVDTAIAGHMPNVSSLGAVAIASALVNTIYWLWGFLRMATTGLVAQAYGRNDSIRISRQLSVGITIAVFAGLLLILIRPLLYKCSFLLSDGNVSLNTEAIDYLKIAFIGAPAALLLYIFNGWFVGMQNTKIPMIIAIVANIINIILTIAFTQYWGMGVEGLALGTVISQYFGVALSIFFAFKYFSDSISLTGFRSYFNRETIRRYFYLGKDLVLRTMLISSVTLFFTRVGSSYGTYTVSANALLMLLFTIFSYFMDGFAYSAEALTGKYIGRCDRKKLYDVISGLFVIGSIFSVITFVLYISFPKEILSLLSDDILVVKEALKYSVYVSFVPLFSFWAFILDGVFVGATNSKAMRNTIVIATVLFFVSYYITNIWLGATALWISFLLYLSGRSIYQLFIYRRIVDKSFS